MDYGAISGSDNSGGNTNKKQMSPTGIDWAMEGSSDDILEERQQQRRQHQRTVCKIVLGTIAALVLLGSGYYYYTGEREEESSSSSIPISTTAVKATTTFHSSKNALTMPDGVNIGSWLSLEDYFFASGSAIEVATPDGSTAAVCLPPLHTGSSTGPTWHAETDLLHNLTQETSLANALQVFHAHRTSFVDFDQEFATLAALGIHSVRIPMSWCLTNEDPAQVGHLKMNHKELAEKYTCQDPFFPDVSWPAIPRSLVVDLLQACARHGLKATLDMHTYPGGTSPGTFSGVWPRWPRFWTHGDQPATDLGEVDIGRQLWQDFVAFVESLDDDTLEGLQALSPMNEPAHLAGIFPNGRGDDQAYLPPLTPEMASAYLERLQQAGGTTLELTQVPDGPHLRVMKWLDDAINTFRTSSLVDKGIQLAVNVHESFLNPSILPPNDGNDMGGRHPGAMKVIGAFWRGVTTPNERSSWAVLDMHHYHSWEPHCQGASDGLAVANYTCSNIAQRREALARCSSWATIFRQAMDQECGAGAKLMSGEMSASTHHSVRHACNDISTLKASFDMQVQAAKQAHVALYWWSYKMPYGGAFRPAWSLKHFLYLMGVLNRPDASEYGCGDHVPILDEPV